MTGLKLIVFDFGGVLLNWDPRFLYRKVFDGDEAGMERFLKEVDFYTWNALQDAGRPFAEGVTAACTAHPEYCELIRMYHERWAESIGGSIEGTVEIARGLKQAGWRLAGLSNWSAETFPLMRDRYEFFNWLEFILLSGEVKVNKPERQIFEILLERAGCPAESCLLIDDSLKNIATAREVGLQTILFESPEQLAGALATMGISLTSAA
jgi:2-haloacid dehalogenase